MGSESLIVDISNITIVLAKGNSTVNSFARSHGKGENQIALIYV